MAVTSGGEHEGHPHHPAATMTTLPHAAGLLAQVCALREEGLKLEQELATTLEGIHPTLRPSARNLLHYLALRRQTSPAGFPAGLVRTAANTACKGGFYPLLSKSWSPAASTRMVSPGPNSPLRMACASAFSSFCWMVRLSGRAP